MVNIVDLIKGITCADGSVVYDVVIPKPLFSKVLRNNNTRALDTTFDLTGLTPIGDDQARYLMHSVGYGTLGDSRVERVLTYFAGFAKSQGLFFGISHGELLDNMGIGTFNAFGEDELQAALTYKDHQNEGFTYLGRSTCNGIDFVFPQNIKKNFFA